MVCEAILWSRNFVWKICKIGPGSGAFILVPPSNLRRARLIDAEETPSGKGACLGYVGGSFLLKKIIANVTTIVRARVKNSSARLSTCAFPTLAKFGESDATRTLPPMGLLSGGKGGRAGTPGGMEKLLRLMGVIGTAGLW